MAPPKYAPGFNFQYRIFNNFKINLTVNRLRYNGEKITVIFFSKFFKNARQDLEKHCNSDNTASAQKLRKLGRHQNFAKGARTLS